MSVYAKVWYYAELGNDEVKMEIAECENEEEVKRMVDMVGEENIFDIRY